jgi:hypothetical protein
MSNNKDERKEHFSARVASFLVLKIREKSRKERRSITSIVEEAFLQYFKDELPGLCGSCRYMNEPADRFCGRCGKPLVEEAWEDYFKNYQEFWWKDEHLNRIEKILVDHTNRDSKPGNRGDEGI